MSQVCLMLLAYTVLSFRCFLSSVWVHGPWPDGTARVWTCVVRRASYSVFHETADWRPCFLPQTKLPSSRHQMF